MKKLNFVAAIEKFDPFAEKNEKRMNKTMSIILTVGAFYMFGFHGSVALTEALSGIQIENIAPNSPWELLRTTFTGLTALICWGTYKILRKEWQKK